MRTCSSSIEKSLTSASSRSGAAIEPTLSTSTLITPPPAAKRSSLPSTIISGSVLTVNRLRS